ncbi:MAG TPA: hypothetical protein VGN34_12045 [Ktedonobacteraceae bacterium]
MGLLDRLSKMKRLLRVYIAGALHAWLCLRFFDGSPAVSSDPIKRWSCGVVRLWRMTFREWARSALYALVDLIERDPTLSEIA